MVSAFAALVLFVSGSSLAQAAGPLDANTSAEARQDAIRGIPFDELAEPAKSKIWKVVAQPTVFRRLPVQVIDCHPDMYLFLVQHPEVVVNIWHLMGISNVTIQRHDARRLFASDGAGTTSEVELLYASRDTHILYAEGAYDGPLVARKITGRCVLVLKSGYSNQNDRNFVTNRLDAFVQLDNVGAEIVAKTLHPIMGRTADRNFHESAEFVSQISRAAERNGTGLQQIVTRLNSVDPDVRTRFNQVVVSISHESALRAAKQTSDEMLAAGELAEDDDSESTSAAQADDLPLPIAPSRLTTPERSGPQLRR